MSHSPPETISVASTSVVCDGVENEPGHPRVFLKMTNAGTVDCPYCARHFVLIAGAKVPAH